MFCDIIHLLKSDHVSVNKFIICYYFYMFFFVCPEYVGVCFAVFGCMAVLAVDFALSLKKCLKISCVLAVGVVLSTKDMNLST